MTTLNAEDWKLSDHKLTEHIAGRVKDAEKKKESKEFIALLLEELPSLLREYGFQDEPYVDRALTE